MRTLSLLAALFGSLAVVNALPANVCSPEKVSLELRPMGTARAASSTGILADYQLAFHAIDQQAANDRADFIDIHFRVNNEDSVNLRVLSESALIDNALAKQAEVNGIQMEEGDVLRAYATYSVNGIACDTAIHTFNAPAVQQQNIRRSSEMSVNALAPQMRRMRRPFMSAEDHFWTQAAAEAEENAQQGACPAIALDQEVLRQAGTQDTYIVSFENKTPARQLHFVDLHLNTGDVNSEHDWANLRLASDMQLNLAHKVMQPGVIVKPNERLNFFWSYRTESADGNIVDCSTPMQSITPAEVTHEAHI